MGEKALSSENYSKTLLRHVQENYIDWMHACGGKGKCTTCKALVLSGFENLGELTDVEKRYRAKGELKDNERLACQCVVLGDVTIRIPEESKLPHILYTD